MINKFSDPDGTLHSVSSISTRILSLWLYLTNKSARQSTRYQFNNLFDEASAWSTVCWISLDFLKQHLFCSRRYFTYCVQHFRKNSLSLRLLLDRFVCLGHVDRLCETHLASKRFFEGKIPQWNFCLFSLLSFLIFLQSVTLWSVLFDIIKIYTGVAFFVFF